MGKRKQKITSSVFPVQFLSCLTIIAAVLFLYFSTRGIYLPYVGYNAWNYTTYSLIAHNYNQFGWFETKLAPITSIAQQLPQQPEYYLHHPPFISILLAIFFSLFGESFWVGRMAVICFSILCLLLIFLLGQEIKGKKFASILTISYGVLPASIVFGRMIGQEVIVLFFALSTLWSILRFVRTHERKYLLITTIGVVLGVLSDWPMIYFVFALFPWLWIKKEKKLGVYIVTLAVSIGFAYLGYIYLIMGSFSDLLNAISVRSLGQLTHLSFWPFRWALTILIRLFFYFNPVIVLLFLYGIIVLVKEKIESTDNRLLIFCLLSWGILHILLFPEGSFGHPYWMYYLLPGFTMIVSLILLRFFEGRRYILLALLFLFSLTYLWRVELWKTKEIEGNVWRYTIGKSISKQFPEYATMSIHPSSPVDYDLLKYSFKYSVNVVPVYAIQNKTRVPYLYICHTACSMSYDLRYLLHEYPYKKVQDSNSEFYIFSVNKPPKHPYIQEKPQIQVSEDQIARVSLVKRVYLYLLTVTRMPQL